MKQKIYYENFTLCNCGSELNSLCETFASSFGTGQTIKKEQCEIEESIVKLELTRTNWNP